MSVDDGTKAWSEPVDDLVFGGRIGRRRIGR